MQPYSEEEALKARVIRAAETALADHQYVSAIDVFLGMGLLAPSNLDAWRKGRVDFLQRVTQGNPKKISRAMAMFRQWAETRGLRPSEIRYARETRAGIVELQFSAGGDGETEKTYRTHYLSPALSESKQQQLAEKLSRPPEPVVFQILRDSQCSECGAEIDRGSLLFMEAGQPLCLPCAALGDLEYLEAGDAALTRRATKHSARKAVVVRFSRSRGRYERRGILVESAALEKAEQECAVDAGERAAARAKGAEERRRDDLVLVDRMTEQVLALFPRCPAEEAREIARHTAVRGSGRVGRTAAGRKLEESALTAAVTAAVRHRHTRYDELLAAGSDREFARHKMADRVHEILASWRA